MTGMPWSLEEYTRRRLRLAQDQEHEERFASIIHRLHALHTAGPDRWWEVGAAICQAYKALEQVTRDRDWSLAWMWTGIQDPRPRGALQRGLAHPLEHAAGLAYLRELHTLHTQRAAAAGRGSWQLPQSSSQQRGPTPQRQPPHHQQQHQQPGEEAAAEAPRGRGRGRRGG